MNTDIQNVTAYINKIDERVRNGHTSEHTFRKDLEDLINHLAPNVMVTNEPSRITDCGNPDFLISKKDIPIGFIEAKDVGKDLKSKVYKEQFDRYKAALDNLIITDYLTFEFYQQGELVHQISIGELHEQGNKKSVKGFPDNYERLSVLLKDFCVFVGQTIKSAQKLATLMAGKARLLENILYHAVTSDEDTDNNTDLRDQYHTFKEVLIHDLTPAEFADIYAQTLAYGMFAARLHDDTLDTFSRQEAAERIPRTNPFLRRLFDYVAGTNIDERIKPTVNNLADVFRATDVAAMLQNFGKTTQTQDPIIHFYETFLAEYNPKLRKQRGVWYTPEPVVQFIVRAVDDVLKTEFGLSDGLADTSKIEIEKQTQTRDSRTKSGFKSVKELVHKVQILDPATGTGTFLAAVIQHIFHSQFENMGGIWSSYVEEDLLPRLHGFELLMASYAMAHLKMDMLLTDTGYEPINPKRMQIYLTNSLEEHHPDTGTLFAGWLSAEANEANAIKRDSPIMVVMGNPPYSVSSSNKGEWIQNLISDYKKDLNERKINLDDDYIKFIRYGQHYIDKNGEGVLAFITNNSFLDGITHRQMRKELMEVFDKIYILDLHGNSNRGETSPDGQKDENVFDIRQGVSINIFIKKRAASKSCSVYSYDLYGLRNIKYDALNQNTLSSLDWKKLNIDNEYAFFKDRKLSSDLYSQGFSLDKLFKIFGTGIETKCDDVVVQYTKADADTVFKDFASLSPDQLLAKYKRKNSKGWNYSNAKKDILDNELKALITPVSYRPFDIRYTLYTGNSSGIMGRPRSEVMKHLLNENFSISSTRSRRNDASCYLISKGIVDKSIASSLDNNYIFPLYSYKNKELLSETTPKSTVMRDPNLNLDIVKEIAQGIGITFVSEKDENTEKSNSEQTTFAPIDILDYIYAVLHSSSYRETYKEFLKIDFPRVPYPEYAEQFWQLVALGSQLRQIHLLESSQLNEKIKSLGVSYPKAGNNTVTRKMTKTSKGFEPSKDDANIGKVWINDEQYFDNVPLIAWEFYIGGYQPAQKWLKDRRDRTLAMDDIKHYMNIIAALTLTDELMQRIDEINIVS